MAISKISRRRLLRSALAAPAVLVKWPALAQQARAILNQTIQLPPPSQLPVISEWPDPFYLNLNDYSGLKQYPGQVRCTTKAQWTVRRSELIGEYKYYENGHAPPPSAVNLVSTESDVAIGTMTQRTYRLSTGPGGQLPFSMNFYLPNNITPRPFANGCPSNGPYPILITSEMSYAPLASNTSGAMASIGTDNAQILVNHGYILAEFGRDDFSLDFDDFPAGQAAQVANSRIFPLYPYDPNGVNGYDWAGKEAWAWGFARVIDFVSTLSFVDQSKIAIFGMSRSNQASGRLAWVDTRVAAVIVSGYPTTIRQYHQNANGWHNPTYDEQVSMQGSPGMMNAYAKNFMVANGSNPQKLPLDLHTFSALIAPKYQCHQVEVYAWDPTGIQQAILATREIYKALGLPISGLGNRLGVYFGTHIPSGGNAHNMGFPYWVAGIDYLDRVLFNHEIYTALARRYSYSTYDFETFPLMPDVSGSAIPLNRSWTAPTLS